MIEVRFGKYIPIAALTLALTIGATACKSSDDDHRGYDPNMDPEAIEQPFTVTQHQGQI